MKTANAMAATRRKSATTTPPSLGVWTYPDGDRDQGSGTWQIYKEDGSLDAVGAGYTPVCYGDKIKLVNQYKIGKAEVGRYLNTYGHVGDTTPPSFGVRTSPSPDRVNQGTANWQILRADDMSYSGPVRNGDKIRLLNQYRIADSKNQHADPPLAGYLDTCGIVKTGDPMIDPSPPASGVRTSPSPDRDEGSGTWLIKVF